MKEKVFNIAYRYLILNLAFLPVILVMRVVEYLFLKHATILQTHPFALEAVGLLYDVKAFVIFALVLLLPFLLISLIHRRSGAIFYAVLLSILALLQFLLIRYFAVNLVPLDDILYAYSFDEIIMITRSADSLGFITFLPIVLILSLVIILQYAGGKIRIQGGMWTLVTATYIAALIVALVPQLTSTDSESETANHHKLNKSAYFAVETVNYIFKKKEVKQFEQITTEIKRYQEIHSEFDFTSKKYPLTHANDVPDVLGPYFNLKKESPNLVFIIVESLSQACVGESAYYGNFTPFLDSLKNHSLYWDNFLSSSERTFHVFASLFGSLPYGGGEFQNDLSHIPFHNSLIRYLNGNGYFTGFYYGGDANFTNYNQFLKKQGIDLIMEDFGPVYREKKKLYPDFLWGYHDEYTFARSLEVIDSMDKDPRLDIYLTLSTHSPFHPPNQEYYLQKYEEITTKRGFPDEKKRETDLNREIFASMLYTDDALRDFFKAWSQREGFDNTIFFITGDHFFMELGYSTISAIERYHVPMIIYSPMLKRPNQFESVSTHQDIAPSVVAMLQNRYSFSELPYVHWIGQGLDTTSSFRNVHAVQFVTASQESEDYLDKNYFLSKNRLYRITPGMKTEPVNDLQMLKRMQEDMRATTVVSKYATGNDRIILPELFMKIDFDTTLIYTKDTSGYLFGDLPNRYINLIKPMQFDSTYLKLEYELDFQYILSEYADTTKLPWLILTIDDTNQQNYLYRQLPFPGIPNDSIKTGEWLPYHVREVLDVSSIDDLSGLLFKAYFFNNRLSKIRCDSLNISISGLN